MGLFKKREPKYIEPHFGGYTTDGKPVALGPTNVFTSAEYDTLAAELGVFTGSKVPGNLPLPKTWRLDYYALRERSWQAYTENEIASAPINRLCQFVVGSGLKLEYEPHPYLTDALGIEIPVEVRDALEADMNLYAESKAASYDGKKTLHQLAQEAYKNVQIAGDILVVLRIVNGDIQIQHIDGGSVMTPVDRAVQLAAAKQGNTITDGIEHDKRGREVAYHVLERNAFLNNLTSNLRDRYIRIPAYGRSGRRVAFLMARDGHRPGCPRGKPRLTSVLETLEIINRYKTAEMLTAEAGATLLGQIENGLDSMGLNPMQNLPAGHGRRTTGQAQELSTVDPTGGEKIAGQVRAVTSASVFNMGRGQKMSLFDTKRPNLDGVKFINECMIHVGAAVDMPYEIGRLLFTDSYSASRAALGMLEIIMDQERQFLMDEYYGIIMGQRQRLRVLQNRVTAPQGYKRAILNRDELLLHAYENYRGVGIVVPQVDPVKEVSAAEKRLMLKLTTHSKETKALGKGDYYANVDALLAEKEAAKKLDEEEKPDNGEDNQNEGDQENDGEDEN